MTEDHVGTMPESTEFTSQHFWASVIYPLDQCDVARLGDEWHDGAFRGAANAQLDVDDRTRFYANPGPAKRLLDPSRRRHRSALPEVDGVLVVDAVELVRVDPVGPTPAGYALVHLRSEGPEVGGFDALADVVRPTRMRARALLTAALGDVIASWVRPVPRAASVVLSGWPAETDDGLLRWPRSTALDRRLATMVTLPDDARALPLEFELPRLRPTPSYVVASSSMSLGVVRVRAMDASSVHELRTLWLDAVLIEVRQRDVASAYAGLVTNLAQGEGGRAGAWTRLATEFRSWRARSAWQATTEHVMEQTLARVIRIGLGTDALVARVETELHDHAEAESRRGADRLTHAVLGLTIAALIVPLLLHLAANGSQDSRDAYWVAAAAVAAVVVVVTAALALASTRGRLR